jgi:tetratricopeptide (TPR) repeat protein
MQRSTASRAALLAVVLLTLPAGAAPRAEVSRSQELRARVFKMLNDGIQAVKEGRPKDAIPLLEQASNIALNSFRAYFYLGVAYKADRQYQKAVEPLQIALELDPVNLQARVTLADCYLKRGDPAEALAEYHRALAQQGDYAPAFDGLGRAAEASGDVEKAVEHYRKAIALNPGFPDASMNLGDLLLREGRQNEAIDLFLQAIRVRPDFAAAYNRLGAAYAQQRLHNEAIAALRKAEVLEKGNPWHPVTIGTRGTRSPSAPSSRSWTTWSRRAASTTRRWRSTRTTSKATWRGPGCFAGRNRWPKRSPCWTPGWPVPWTTRPCRRSCAR